MPRARGLQTALGNKVVLEGGAELLEALTILAPKVALKVVRGALRKAIQPVLHAARSKVPVVSGALASSLTVRARTNKKKGSLGVEVATKDGMYKGDQFYGAFVELGTSRAPAHPFMRPALDENAGRVIDIFKAEAGNGIEKAMSTKKIRKPRNRG